MKNTFGNNISVTVYGESHGPEVGVVLDGFAPGIPIDTDFIARQLSLRRPAGNISTARRESDDFRIASGVFNGYTTGTPILISVPNVEMRSGDYEAARALARPGHADYTAYLKYHGFEDYRGGGHFSGRVTAGLAAGGAIALSALKRLNISIGTHILRCAGIEDRDFSDPEKDIPLLEGKAFAVLDDDKADEMRRAIESAARNGDSVGGVLESMVVGFPEGVGEPWFDTVEGMLSHALFGIPAVKGVEFGSGFDLADMPGSRANDPFCLRNGKIATVSNHNGGVNGGVTNGMPIVFRCAVKPTPSIAGRQETVDFIHNTPASIEITGRHDPAVIHRAAVVVTSVAALVLCDLLAGRFGTDYLRGNS